MPVAGSKGYLAGGSKGYIAGVSEGFPAGGSEGFPAAGSVPASDKDVAARGERSPWLDAVRVVDGVPADTSAVGRQDARGRVDRRSRLDTSERHFRTSDLRGGGTQTATRVFFVSGGYRGAEKVSAGGEKNAAKLSRVKELQRAPGDGTRPEGRAKDSEWALVSLDGPTRVAVSVAENAENAENAYPNPYRHSAVRQTGRVIAAAACWNIAAESKSPLADTMRLLKETSIWSEMNTTEGDLQKK
jgi:hypothetical protein